MASKETPLEIYRTEKQQKKRALESIQQKQPEKKAKSDSPHYPIIYPTRHKKVLSAGWQNKQ